MILYLDTSAFLKLYLREPGSGQVRGRLAGADAVCTHLITYAEMRAALAQAARMQRIDTSALPSLVQRFERDWTGMEVIAADRPLVRQAGNLAERFALRGYDSVHLAAAERVSETVARGRFWFMAYDKALRAAAETLGMPVPA